MSKLIKSAGVILVLDKSKIKLLKEKNNRIKRKKRKFNKRYLFLLIKQKNGEHWGYPKGHIESHEKPINAAVREVYEEVGINVNKLLDFKIKSKYKVNFIDKEVIYFLSILKDKDYKIQKEEIIKAYWLSFKKAKKKITYKNDKKILKEVKVFLKKKK